jgi:hypothetical protein
VLGTALSQAQVQALAAATHPCPAVAVQFTINHDGVGINCLAEAVTVNVIDAMAGTPLTSYNAQVRLDTQTGYGTWALVAGGGTFSDGAAGDGIATYNWPLGESSAQFTLTTRRPPAVDVDVYQISNNGIRDNDAEGASCSPNYHVTAPRSRTRPASSPVRVERDGRHELRCPRRIRSTPGDSTAASSKATPARRA